MITLSGDIQFTSDSNALSGCHYVIGKIMVEDGSGNVQVSNKGIVMKVTLKSGVSIEAANPFTLRFNVPVNNDTESCIFKQCVVAMRFYVIPCCKLTPSVRGSIDADLVNSGSSGVFDYSYAVAVDSGSSLYGLGLSLSGTPGYVTGDLEFSSGALYPCKKSSLSIDGTNISTSSPVYKVCDNIVSGSFTNSLLAPSGAVLPADFVGREITLCHTGDLDVNGSQFSLNSTSEHDKDDCCFNCREIASLTAPTGTFNTYGVYYQGCDGVVVFNNTYTTLAALSNDLVNKCVNPNFIFVWAENNAPYSFAEITVNYTATVCKPYSSCLGV